MRPYLQPWVNSIDKTNQEYCAALENEDADLDVLTRVYMAAVSSTIHLAKCLIHKEPEIELRVNLEKLRTNVNVAYEHAESRDTSAVDPVKVFKQEFDRCVGDIIKIRDMEREVSWQVATGGDEADESLFSYTRYQENLQCLHAKLKQFDDHYFVEIDKDDADVLKLQKEFNKELSILSQMLRKPLRKILGFGQIWMWFYRFCFSVRLCLDLSFLLVKKLKTVIAFFTEQRKEK